MFLVFCQGILWVNRRNDVDQARRIMDSVLQSVKDALVAAAPKAVCCSNVMNNLKEQTPKSASFQDASAKAHYKIGRFVKHCPIRGECVVLIKDALFKPSDLGRFGYRLLKLQP